MGLLKDSGMLFEYKTKTFRQTLQSIPCGCFGMVDDRVEDSYYDCGFDGRFVSWINGWILS